MIPILATLASSVSWAATAVKWVEANYRLILLIGGIGAAGLMAFTYERALEERDAAVTAQKVIEQQAKVEIAALTSQRDAALKDAAANAEKAKQLQADADYASSLTANLEAQKAALETQLKATLPAIISAAGANDPAHASLKAALDAIKASQGSKKK